MIIWTIWFFSAEWLRKEKLNSALFFGTTELISELFLIYMALDEVL